MSIVIVDVNSTTQVSLTGDNDVYVSAGVLLNMLGVSENAITAPNGDHSAIIDGQVSGTNRGILLGNSVTDFNNSIEIRAGGKVFGDGAAINIWGANSTVVNRGVVVGGEYGIEVLSPTSSTTSSVTNSGTILANQAILNESGGGQGTLTINNTGTIIGFTTSFTATFDPTSIERIYNKGRMEGDIAFFGGNDLYDGRGGTFKGTVFGGVGNDVFYGGAGVEIFDGEANNDTFTGGLGKDRITTGIDSDKIIFNAMTEIGDIVTDFLVADELQFKRSAFGNLALGTLSSAAYYESNAGLAHDASDRFIYELDADRLWYDKDGTGSAARVLVIDMTTDVNISNADIRII